MANKQACGDFEPTKFNAYIPSNNWSIYGPVGTVGMENALIRLQEQQIRNLMDEIERLKRDSNVNEYLNNLNVLLSKKLEEAEQAIRELTVKLDEKPKEVIVERHHHHYHEVPGPSITPWPSIGPTWIKDPSPNYQIWNGTEVKWAPPNPTNSTEGTFGNPV